MLIRNLSVIPVALWAALCFSSVGHADPNTVRLSTTTSVENSGLISVLKPAFEVHCHCRLDVVVFGTGHTLALGRSGDVDVVLVHAPKAERAFVAKGHGVMHTWLMENDFIVVGPETDPAHVADADGIFDVLGRIASSQAVFVSRGDGSGTHLKEQALWQGAKRSPQGDWYRKVGQGMGRTLTIANQMGAYALTDRGTYLAMADKLDLVAFTVMDHALLNPYGIIAVNPQRHPQVNHRLAVELIRWLTSAPAKTLIDGYRVGGQQLFRSTPSGYSKGTAK